MILLNDWWKHEELSYTQHLMNACEHIFYDFPLPGVMIAVNILRLSL